MLIADYTIEHLGWRNARISWTGTAGLPAWVFLNGKLALTPFIIDGTDKSVTLSLPNPCILEIHEADDAEDIAAIAIALERKPVVWWTSRKNAQMYRVYHRPASGTEVLLAAMQHVAELLHHELAVTRDLRQDGAAWSSMRVEAVNARGQESVHDEWPLFSPGVPAEPSGLQVSGTGGTFSFTLEV